MMMRILGAVHLVLLWGYCTGYQVGVGIGDCTGPAAEVTMMGYGKMDQKTEGIHQRQFCRAFIVADPETPHKSTAGKRVAFVSVDAGMISPLVKIEVVRRLRALFGSLYTDENVCISGTHTHSGPGGFLQYVLFQVTSLGFVKESFNALVDGIVQSIQRAHHGLVPGRIRINEGDLLNSNINRSPTAYLHNPAQERDRYQHNVDKEMVLLRFEDSDGQALGSFNWFSVHGTSMNNTNTLISGDNKGYASYLFEKHMDPESLPGKSRFVAAFASTNLGDVSPNTRGPRCMDTGLPCDTVTSSCHNKPEMCVASGPGRDMFESTQLIGSYQFTHARNLYESAQVTLRGPVDYRLKYVDMSDLSVQLENGTTVRTCKPAMGYSFAAGTTDGPGSFSFTQGDRKGNEFWNLIRNFIKKPSKELQDCQAPKPILLATGEMSLPYAWQPNIVDVQVLRIGQLVILGVPGEFTTMSGRRLREKVTQVLRLNGFPLDTKVVIAGLTNTYSDYITTFEEYQAQRYEGASTIYGPHTLSAYLQEFSNISKALAQGLPVSKGPPPPDLMSRQVTLQTGVVYDTVPPFKHFGDVLKQPRVEYNPGDRVEVVFRSGHPKNNLMHGGTFLEIQQKQVDRSWTTIATDGSWETRYRWKRTSSLLGRSQVTITWDVPHDQETGSYRVIHHGFYKSFFGGQVHPYSGTTRPFQVHPYQKTGVEIHPSGIRGFFHQITGLFHRPKN